MAQQEDTLSVLPADSLKGLSSDTLISKSQTKSDIDTIVYSSASDSLIFFIKQKKMNIYGDGKIDYRQMQITAADISINFDTHIIDAAGKYEDSLGGKLTDTPVLSEAGESYEAKTMSYNFKTGRGTMSAVNTEMEGAYYTGEKIKKVDKKVYFIEDGKYTTCNEKDPHYYIYSPKMKVIQDEELVAEWIWLYFGDVPFPVPLPFGVFPLESGRRSGIIAPVFGSDGRYGTYIGRFGYYWAMSDYTDLNLTGDYYTRGSFALNSRFRYVKRYTFSGSLEGSYEDFTQGESTDPDYNKQIDWRLRWYHNQTITPTLRLNVNLEFLSSNYLTKNVSDLNEALRNEIVSNATLSKTWEESGNSMSINYNRRQVIQSNDIYEVLPSITFSLAQSYPFRSTSTAENRSWYENFGYSYNGAFQNNRNKVGGDLNIRGGFKHNVILNLSPKIGYVSITPRFIYRELWYNKRIKQYSVESSVGTDSVVTEDVHEINFVRTFDAGVSASTKFFGIFKSPIPGIQAFRHIVTPSITYSYHPDFSGSGWGYYDTYTTLNGTEVKYNKFQKEIFGGAGSGKSSSLSFSVGNVFEMKTTADPTDTTAKEEKYQLLNLNFGMGYNFAADSLNFSDLRLTYRTQIGDFIDFNGSNTFTLYDYAGNLSRINKFLVDEGKGLLRMTNFNFTISTRLSGERLKSKETGDTTNTGESSAFDNPDREVYQGLYSTRDPDFSIPWDISLTYSYNLNRQIPEQETKYQSLSGSLNFNLTPAWKFSVTGSYDFERHKFAAPQIRISRDLHCWLMNFTWNPIGTYRGFRFEIRIKAPQLQDLKITKQGEFYNTSR
jgi:lipopolysaccharide assembly outer membrane protein LptD (OstA)